MQSPDSPDRSDSTSPPPGPYEESWEPQVAAKRIREEAALKGENEILMVGLVGYPGSGKTISAIILANSLEEYGLETMVMGQDGYHYPLEYLKSFPNAEDAIYRRGAPDTFDPSALMRDLERIKDGDEELITVPGFDHAVGDPEPNKHAFDRNRHKVVICEGLYLLHDEDGWEGVASYFDLTIFMNSDVDICIERVKIRNQCIPGYTAEDIAVRCEKVDRVNSMIVMATKEKADMIVEAKVTMPTDIPKTPSVMDLALTSLTQTHVDGAETNDNADWAMDFTPLSRNDSFVSRVRSDSVVSCQSEPPPEPAAAFIGSWEPEIAEKIKEAVAQADKLPYMVALVGTPGSGKSVCSFLLTSILESSGIKTMICPHDGYHYPLEYLRSFPDAEDFIYRRGAPDTFDPQALHRDLLRIRDGDEDMIKLPAFDHSKGDPEPDTHIFDRQQHKVVLCEGLYLLHDRDGWEDICSIFDLTLYLDTDLETCIDRVKYRNQCIPGYTPEEIAVRTEKVDRVNALTVMASKRRADIVVKAATT